LNSVGIELFVNMGYFINVFFVDKLFFTAESRSPAWPCNVELPQPSSKEYDSDYSDDDDDDNEMDELSVDQMIFFIVLENKNTNINLHHLFIMVKMVPSDLSFQIFLSDQWNSVRNQ
jgi:hypothetical protein